jgi:type VI secretion system secreted protein VgrG
MPITDKNVPIKLITPLGADKLLVRSIQGAEEISGLFSFSLDLVSDEPDLEFDKVVGQNVTVSLKLNEEEDRYFNGFVTEFMYSGADGQFYRYHAAIRPWLWLLTRTSDCRIFQGMDVPEIIKEIFRLNNMVDYRVMLNGTYRTWNYCVQYNETDFDFISRLMEQEGIYYFFTHEKGKHVLVLADAIGAHEKYPGFGEIVYLPDLKQGAVIDKSLNSWTATQSMMPDRYAMQDFDFENPKVNLLSVNKKPDKHAWPLDDPEIFDYPGEYVIREEGERYVKVRLEELQCQRIRKHASGRCRGLAAGHIFDFSDYPRADQNGEYLIVSIEHEMNNHEFGVGELKDQTVYSCDIEVMDSKVPFRSPRKTRKPIVRGPQTAIVVGPEADEIYTDHHGRVKVQFHWDRYGTKDESSSCWVRVSQLWAGTKWGGIHIPRIGQEVVVSFLEGDPDRPLITGSVYNANTQPPYTLPGNKTQSGIKSRSTLEGGPDNFNEIRMEDKKGSEELYIQAEKDENILVKNDKSETVQHNETINIGNDRHETVDRNETIIVKNDRLEAVHSNEDLSVAKVRTRSVGEDESVSIGKSKTHTVGENESVNIGNNQVITVSNDQSISVEASRSLSVGKEHTITVGKSETRNIGEKLVITAGDSILLECGSSSISMKKNGDILISGKNLVLEASGKATVKASQDLVLKGSKVTAN